ncbi:conserved hypothetical protein [Desulfosarcina cetonica]|nr:conserved hypothetical protein [Desulfosarcina cetonica]
MGQIKKILVALAATEYCRGIFDYTVTLATALDADILVASIINSRDIDAVRQMADMGYQIDADRYVADIRATREQEIEAVLRRTDFPPDRIRVVIHTGKPIDELLRVIKQESVDMLVMGTKGRTDIEHILMGSVADKMFRKSPVTIVSYRDAHQAQRIQKRLDL